METNSNREVLSSAFQGRRFLPGLVVLLVASLLELGSPRRGEAEGPVQISYSTFMEELRSGNVARVVLAGDQISGLLKKPAEKRLESHTATFTQFVTYLPSLGDDRLLPMLEQQRVELETRPGGGSFWAENLGGLFFFLLLLALGFMIFQRLRTPGQDLFSFGRSQARLYDRQKERTTFQDVAGARAAKMELQEIRDYLTHPERFQRLGGKMFKGALLVGPPGTGKTLLARAVAGEADVPFFSITGSDFMEMFVGVGASRVRHMFREAKRVSPCIIFIDELDSIGRRRGLSLGGGHDEREQTLNQLLSELDGFEPNIGIIVMAATNRPDILDPALLRPGRFDRRIMVDLPTLEDRVEILRIHSRDKVMAENFDLRRLARGTPGFSGADLANLLNEAALLAARKDKEAIQEEDIEEARDKVLIGLERGNLALTEEECRLLAYHEGGHAVVAAVLPYADPVHKVTIVPRGRAMGVTQQLPEREKNIYPKNYLLDRLAVMMGGRAAEALVLGTATSGAEDDLKQATHLVRKMVLDWGMGERLGNIALGGRHESFLGAEGGWTREYSEMMAWRIDEEIRRILEEVYGRAAEILIENRAGLDRVAEALMEKEEIQGREVLELIGRKELPSGKERGKEIREEGEGAPEQAAALPVKP
ncbi:MAG: ATP-dependent metallopeptidase FtsH/Yme1/Tma family protein [Deltaproteobacteria bacterium]|nr:ATP-dependent metallopeptidase FtsH/Yme1/Tma family protein [Deltaproteobacteria bacterium]